MGSQDSPLEGAVPLASPQHPLDNFSSERERGPVVQDNGTADVTVKKVDGVQGLRTPASDAGSGGDDQAQLLYDQFMTITSQPATKPTSGFPADSSPLAANNSLLGVFGVGPPPANNSTISTIDGPATGASAPSMVNGVTLSSSDVSSKEYWNNLIDGESRRSAQNAGNSC